MKYLLLLLLSFSVSAQTIDQVQIQGSKAPSTKSWKPKSQAVNKQSQKQQQQQAQQQYQKSISSSASTSEVGDQANSQNINVEAGPAPIVLIPQGHTANCLRTYGISFGNKDGGGGVGWPYRDKDCDFDNEAADAFAAGQWRIGWYWNCQKKSSYKSFKRYGPDKGQMIRACYDHMVQLYEVPPPEESADIIFNECGDHPEIHERIFEKCQAK